MTIEIEDVPSYKMVDLSIVMLVYQRVLIPLMKDAARTPQQGWVRKVQESTAIMNRDYGYHEPFINHLLAINDHLWTIFYGHKTIPFHSSTIEKPLSIMIMAIFWP